MDVLRAVGFAFELASKPFRVTCGLLGALSYDFIDQFEKLPANEDDILGNPDYEMYFADNIFLMDHKNGKGHVVVNAIITDDDRDAIYDEAMQCFEAYFETAKEIRPDGHPVYRRPLAWARHGYLAGRIRGHGQYRQAAYH